MSLATSNAATITTDTSVAAASFALAADTGSSNSDGVTTNGTVNVSLASDLASWQYRLQSGEWQTGSGSSFSLAANTRYAAGAIEVRQTDTAGNLSVVANNTGIITTDTSQPARPDFGLADDTGASATDLYTAVGTVDVVLEEGVASWEYYIDGLGWQPGTGRTFELPANSSFGGGGSILVRQTDAAGNESMSMPNDERITTDSIAPGLPSFALAADTGSSNSDGVTTNATINVTLASDAASWQYRLQSGEWQNGSGTSFSLAANTSYAAGGIEVRQTDTAGNVSLVTSNAATITTDTTSPTAPTVTAASVFASYPTYDPDIAATPVSGGATLLAGEQLNVTVDGELFSNVAVTDGVWQIAREEIGALTSGASVEVLATVVDLAGNQTSDNSSNELSVKRDDVVVFDLINGKSSLHGDGRSFKGDVDYDIFLMVESDDVAILFSSGLRWSGWSNLGTGDTVWLVGNDSTGVRGLANIIVTATYGGTSRAIIWGTIGGTAFSLTKSSDIKRMNGVQTQTFSDFAPGLDPASLSFGYLAQFNPTTSFGNVMVTQGLS